MVGSREQHTNVSWVPFSGLLETLKLLWISRSFREICVGFNFKYKSSGRTLLATHQGGMTTKCQEFELHLLSSRSALVHATSSY